MSSEDGQTIYRHVTSGRSFGANPLQQHLGVGKALTIETLEISWPTSRTTQVFKDVAVDQVMAGFCDVAVAAGPVTVGVPAAPALVRLTVKLVLVKATSLIAGTVVDANGVPVPGVEVGINSGPTGARRGSSTRPARPLSARREVR